MLLDHVDNGFSKYKFRAKLSKKETKKQINNIGVKDKASDLIKGDLKAPIYKLIHPTSRVQSYIVLTQNVSNNVIRVPEKVFDLMDCCKEISFVYKPNINIYKEVQKYLKSIIDSTISLMEIAYQVMTKFYNSFNFDIYLSLISKTLETQARMLETYTKATNITKKFCDNVNYTILSTNNIGVGMIDPGGCLFIKENQFTYKQITFKPIVVLDNTATHFNLNAAGVTHGCFNGTLSKYLNTTMSSSDIIDKWVSKVINRSENTLLLMNEKYFSCKDGVKQKLCKEGCKLERIA